MALADQLAVAEFQQLGPDQTVWDSKLSVSGWIFNVSNEPRQITITTDQLTSPKNLAQGEVMGLKNIKTLNIKAAVQGGRTAAAWILYYADGAPA